LVDGLDLISNVLWLYSPNPLSVIKEEDVMNSKTADRLATGVFIAIAIIIISILVGLFSFILINGLKHVSLHFLTTPSSNVMAGGGIRDQLFNSFYVLIITMLITIPLGLGGGIYMAEYAKPGKVTDTIRSCIEVLASLPSIVIGMFGLLMFVNLTGWGYTILGGALALTVFNLPVLVRVSEDAIRAVPRDLKEASLALGVTQWHTIKTVILPSAFPSILTGAILAAGRVFGEAAALLFTAGLSTPRLDYTNWNPFSDQSPLNIFRPAETLAVHIWSVNTQGLIPDVEEVSNGSAAVLVLSVLLCNLLARWIGSMIHKKITATK
jgi:phosphate transport system permease protein